LNRAGMESRGSGIHQKPSDFIVQPGPNNGNVGDGDVGDPHLVAIQLDLSS